MIRAFVFDLDGTLVETEALKALTYARAAVELRPGRRQPGSRGDRTDEARERLHKGGTRGQRFRPCSPTPACREVSAEGRPAWR
jgi:beta-phosphoglucomutase-like phosphatase (HAD superfamily)